MQSLLLKTRQALVLALLLSFSAMQVFAMTTMPIAMDLNSMAVVQDDCSNEHTPKSLALMSQMVELPDLSHSAHMPDQDCNADHCMMGTAIIVSGLTIGLAGVGSEVASVDVSADSIDIHPPYYPPISR